MGSFPEMYNDPRLGGSVTERLDRWTCNLEASDWFSVVLSSIARPASKLPTGSPPTS